MILGDVGGSDEQVLALLRRSQRHPHPRVQEETMTSYGKVTHPEAERYLLAGLDEKDPTLCGRAVIALGARHSTHERVLRFLTETLRRKGRQEYEADDRLQINACLALETIVAAHPGVAESFKPLLQGILAKEMPLLSSLTGQKFQPKSPEVRQAVQKVLARIDHLAAAAR
jgi:hypothetical protein